MSEGVDVGDFTLDLPSAFIEHNQEAAVWLRALPALLARLAAQWSLTLAPPFPSIAINYVAPATRPDGAPCVLKVSRHIEDTRYEIAALRLWDVEGAVRLLAADAERGALVIERFMPGTELTDIADVDDDTATGIAARVLTKLWRPAPTVHELCPLDRWCAAYDRNRDALSGGVEGFPSGLFLHADALRHELLASTVTPTVLHGDLHHHNILATGRAEWLAIDPKGLVGDPCFDVCQFFRNSHSMPPTVNRRRLDRFCADLGLDRERVKGWCLVHSVLDACWDFEDGNSWARAIAYAEETQTF
ncbi:MAG TPA: aminoglycoside phosphotransferase family protein [Thermomicrobiales bacterium]